MNNGPIGPAHRYRRRRPHRLLSEPLARRPLRHRTMRLRPSNHRLSRTCLPAVPQEVGRGGVSENRHRRRDRRLLLDRRPLRRDRPRRDRLLLERHPQGQVHQRACHHLLRCRKKLPDPPHRQDRIRIGAQRRKDRLLPSRRCPNLNRHQFPNQCQRTGRATRKTRIT